MPEHQDGQQPEPLEEFIDELTRLRETAGNPSFRQMAARSGAVSHATLHQTITGNRLQPWETVREFVRACDGDEEAFHDHWERTHLALAEPTDSVSNGTTHASDRRGVRWWPRRDVRTLVTMGASLVVVACAVAVAFAVVDDRSAKPVAGAAPSPQDATPARASSTGPVTPGDASRFIRDVTIPDDTVVEPGEKFLKVWEIQNVGTVKWHDRYLQRTDEHQGRTDCRTPRRIPIKDTLPNETVKIRVRATAPSTASADCKVDWKMVDDAGHRLFPSSRPVFFLVHVRT